MNKLIRHEINGGEFFLVEIGEDREQCLVVRHICELSGLAFDARRRRLGRAGRWRYAIIETEGRNGRSANVAVIPLTMGMAWLMAIPLHEGDDDKKDELERLAQRFEELSIDGEVESRLTMPRACHERIGQHVLAIRPL